MVKNGYLCKQTYYFLYKNYNLKLKKMLGVGILTILGMLVMLITYSIENRKQNQK
tara:strand:- start:8215 stop:8379 length:165 start_codon:yes stop_codon:yes gene_type:complete